MKVAIYPGSFNPFHKGHYDILLKAEKIFDKVILVRATNPEKEPPTTPLPDVIKDREIINYKGLLTNLIKELPYDNITIVKGLRNPIDFEYEKLQYRFMQDLMPEIQFVSFFSDSEFEHISSSSIKLLNKFGEDLGNKYLI